MTDNNTHNSIRQCLGAHLKKFFDMHDDGKNDPTTGLYDRIMYEVERELIKETLLYSNNVQVKASKILGIHRNTLRKKIESLKLTNL
jgi:DNA-binding protein Fis